MCAEFTPGQPLEVEKLLQGLAHLRILFDPTKYQGDPHQSSRIFPHQLAPIIFCDPNSREFIYQEAEFGLIPHWWKPQAKEKRPRFATYNARLESIEEKASFKTAFKNSPCLIPIDQFFETSDPEITAHEFSGHRVGFSTGKPLWAAGAREEWLQPETGELIPSFTIITTTPDEAILKVGHDRSPVFLNTETALSWVQEKQNAPQKFLLDHALNLASDWQITKDRKLKSR
ncbi:MAG: SOS response-associated peptidase [Pseudobdellovibrionaceae bacterium]